MLTLLTAVILTAQPFVSASNNGEENLVDPDVSPPLPVEYTRELRYDVEDQNDPISILTHLLRSQDEILDTYEKIVIFNEAQPGGWGRTIVGNVLRTLGGGGRTFSSFFQSPDESIEIPEGTSQKEKLSKLGTGIMSVGIKGISSVGTAFSNGARTIGAKVRGHGLTIIFNNKRQYYFDAQPTQERIIRTFLIQTKPLHSNEQETLEQNALSVATSLLLLKEGRNLISIFDYLTILHQNYAENSIDVFPKNEELFSQIFMCALIIYHIRQEDDYSPEVITTLLQDNLDGLPIELNAVLSYLKEKTNQYNIEDEFDVNTAEGQFALLEKLVIYTQKLEQLERQGLQKNVHN
jgi:hypothetical protein